MDKTSIKNFSIWARNKLIADITYKAGLLGVTEGGIKDTLPQSTKDAEFYDIGTKEPYTIHGEEIKQRKELVSSIRKKADLLPYKDAYRSVIEEVAYTWFNRLIAIRFMEVNDYLPSHIRVLSSEGKKLEPDLVTTPYDAEIEFSSEDNERIARMKNDNEVDALFRFLFIRQCNALNAYLPKLFEKTSDYTELLLNVSVTDQDGIVYHLTHDIKEDDFNISNAGEDGKPTGQVEIIGWMYQYYNTEPKDEAFALLKSNVKITKERIPAATQLFTPDWIVRYMVENSVGRLWLEGHENDNLKKEWKYFLDEAEQDTNVIEQLKEIRDGYKNIKPEEIKVIDLCMGSGHILVYAFDVLMQIYESYGYSQRDAAKSIVENNIYGLDIDDRAFQLSYFAIMMKARSYNRRFLTLEVEPNVCAIQESNGLQYDKEMGDFLLSAEHRETLKYLLSTFHDAKEYGSILEVEKHDYIGFIEAWKLTAEQTAENILVLLWYSEANKVVPLLAKQAMILSEKYDVIVTNPPYMGSKNINGKLLGCIQEKYTIGKADIYSAFIMKSLDMTKKNGLLSFITPYVWMYLSSFEEFRKYILENSSILSLIQLEYNAFEVACVPVCTYTLRKESVDYKGRYIQLSAFKGWENQEPKTLAAIENFPLDYCFETKQSKYETIFGVPIAYWLKESVYRVFENLEKLEKYGCPRQGMATADNGRFMRRWFEVNYDDIDFKCTSRNNTTKRWYPHSKGGSVRRWYGNNEHIINWQNDGSEIRNFKKAVVRNPDYYFKSGITWSDLTISWFTARYIPNGFTFDSAGPTFFANNEDTLLYLCGYFNSWIFQEFLNISCQGMHYSNGIISKLPVIWGTKEQIEEISRMVQENIDLEKEDWDESEESWDFKRNVLLNSAEKEAIIENLIVEYIAEKDRKSQIIKENEEKINIIFADIFDMHDVIPSKGICNPTLRTTDKRIATVELISYFVGCLFGRYSLDTDGIACGGNELENRLYNSDFLPDADNVVPINDETYFSDDIVGRFKDWVKICFGEANFTENINFISNVLGNKGNTPDEIIRNYFIKDFFNDHCKMYQKRPIYWLFDSGKANGFKALMYVHRYNENTIGNLRIDYLHRLQRVYENELRRVEEVVSTSSDARESTTAQKRIDKIKKQIKECQEYDQIISHLALARINLDLNDGIKNNYEKLQSDKDEVYCSVLAKVR